MKNFHIPANSLTPVLREAINNHEDGCYIVYGIFIYNDSLSINRLHKGKFSEIQVQVIEREGTVEADSHYLVPVPEFIVNEYDTEYSKYVNLHLIREEDMKPDDELIQDFIKAFTSKLASVDTNDLDSSEDEGQVINEVSETESKMSSNYDSAETSYSSSSSSSD